MDGIDKSGCSDISGKKAFILNIFLRRGGYQSFPSTHVYTIKILGQFYE